MFFTASEATGYYWELPNRRVYFARLERTCSAVALETTIQTRQSSLVIRLAKQFSSYNAYLVNLLSEAYLIKPPVRSALCVCAAKAPAVTMSWKPVLFSVSLCTHMRCRWRFIGANSRLASSVMCRSRIYMKILIVDIKSRLPDPELGHELPVNIFR